MGDKYGSFSIQVDRKAICEDIKDYFDDVHYYKMSLMTYITMKYHCTKHV